MASLDDRSNPLFTFKECSSCGALHNKSHICSKGGFVGKFVHASNKTPDSSQRPPHYYPKCGNPVDGPYCQGCALLRKKLKEVWSTISYEDEIFQDFLNTSESSNDKTNVVVPQEPFDFNQDPGENSSQSPPHIDHHCCYECGDSLDDIFCQRCTCKSCGKGAHYGYNCPPQVLIRHAILEMEIHLLMIPLLIFNSLEEEYSYFGLPSCVAITPVLSTEEPVDSLIMEDEHLDAIPATESDEVIKSSVEILVPIPSKSEGIPDNMCDVPFRDNSPPLDISKYQFEGLSDSNDDSTSIDDDSFSIGDINYVEALPPDSELVSLEEIEAINSNPPPSSDFVTKIALDFEASRARGFVLRSLELQTLSFIMGIQYPNLID
ncbi:hypothetical protein Tco_1430267 [Tanacetum coccineum]